MNKFKSNVVVLECGLEESSEAIKSSRAVSSERHLKYLHMSCESMTVFAPQRLDDLTTSARVLLGLLANNCS